MSNVENQEIDLEQAIKKVERSLLDLEERYNQVKQDQLRRSELLETQSQLQSNPLSKTQEIRQQLKEIEKELETIEFDLESKLFSWGSWKEPFWQAVRFGGLGLVMGWLLKSGAG